jgi:hypothetical protein
VVTCVTCGLTEAIRQQMGYSSYCLHTKAGSHISAPTHGSDLGVALDSLEASGRCLTAWPPSDESTGFLRLGGVGGHPIPRSGTQRRLKVLGFVSSIDRIADKATVQSHGEGLSRGIVPQPEDVVVIARKTAMRSRRVGADHPWRGPPPAGGRVKPRSRRVALTSYAHIFRQLSARGIGFYCANIPKNSDQRGASVGKLLQADVCEVTPEENVE